MCSRSNRRIQFLVLLLSIVFISLSGCTGPTGPSSGTPAWYWQAAQRTWGIGDLQKTSDNLESLSKATSEFADRAQPWQLVLTGGMATSWMKIANALEDGAEANEGAATVFRKFMNDFRSRANREAVQFYETFGEFQKANREGPVSIAFSFPQGSTVSVSELTRARKGVVPSDPEMVTAEQRSLQREVLMATCHAVGAKEDTAKAREIFSAESVTVPKDTFLFAMAEKFHELAHFYSQGKLQRPDRMRLFNRKALEALQTVPESDETKELTKKIEEEIETPGKR